MRRAVKAGLLAIVLGGVLLLFVFPARTLLAQDRSLAAARRQQTVLAKENASLRRQIAKLQSSSYIERIARQQYGLVMPGEKAFAIVPPPERSPSSTTTTTVAPRKRSAQSR